MVDKEQLGCSKVENQQIKRKVRPDKPSLSKMPKLHADPKLYYLKKRQVYFPAIWKPMMD